MASRHLGAALLAIGVIAAAPANASLVADGITYTLTETSTVNPLTDHFVLSISGINGAADTEGGRSGVNAIAFNDVAHMSSATPPAGFVFVDGGLAAAGCNQTGNFFCFDNTSIPPIPVSPLPVNSSLSFAFDVTLSSGSFAGYNPGFKIDWVGSKNNYDLVSQTLTPTPAPEPTTLSLLGVGLLGVGLYQRRRQRRAAA